MQSDDVVGFDFAT